MGTAGWYARPAARAWSCAPAPGAVRDFHARLPGYAPTPLVEAPGLAVALGAGRVFVKDESSRLGLPAFKVLGASWAVAQVLAARTGAPAELGPLRTALATRPALELITATDGNHGRAVARVASVLGLPARVYVPAVTRPVVVHAIAGEGATVVTVDGPYAAAVRAARDAAGQRAGVLVQDTAWPGYETVPGWIVEGYSTLFREIDTQLGAAGAGPAGLVAVPVGVGSLAQAAVTHHRGGPRVAIRGGGPRAALLGVEPDTAACVLTSLHAGAPRSVPTAATIMAGLNCGTPSSLAWPYLRDGLDAAVAVTDAAAAAAVGDLRAHGVTAGPSGAAALAGAAAALTGDGSAARRAALGADRGTVVVLLSTEGATGVADAPATRDAESTPDTAGATAATHSDRQAP